MDIILKILDKCDDTYVAFKAIEYAVIRLGTNPEGDILDSDSQEKLADVFKPEVLRPGLDEEAREEARSIRIALRDGFSKKDDEKDELDNEKNDEVERNKSTKSKYDRPGARGSKATLETSAELLRRAVRSVGMLI